MLDATRFTTSLGETHPVSVRDRSSQDPDATSSCDVVRGGKRPSDAEQTKLLKQTGRLPVLAGDPICQISAYCWTIEEPERFKRQCAARGRTFDDALDACVQVVAAGAHDVKIYRLLDPDTCCMLEVRGGPSNTDNDQIYTCAKTARDQIGPAQIAVP